MTQLKLTVRGRRLCWIEGYVQTSCSWVQNSWLEMEPHITVRIGLEAQTELKKSIQNPNRIKIHRNTSVRINRCKPNAMSFGSTGIENPCSKTDQEWNTFITSTVKLQVVRLRPFRTRSVLTYTCTVTSSSVFKQSAQERSAWERAFRMQTLRELDVTARRKTSSVHGELLRNSAKPGQTETH